MTLREYLEAQIYYYSNARSEYPLGHHMHHLYSGYFHAYSDILEKCLPSMLDRKILDEVW